MRPETLGFSARKFADGKVRSHIKYGGEIKLSNDPLFPPGTFIWFQGIDNGEGADAPPDQSTGSGFGTEEENEAFCDSPDEPNPLFLAGIDGNIQVRD